MMRVVSSLSVERDRRRRKEVPKREHGGGMRSSSPSSVALLCLLVLAQCLSEEVRSTYRADYAKFVMADVINRLGVKLLAIQNEYDENNIAISPYGALSVLIALGEGLQGDAVREIQLAARIPNDISVIRQGLRDINRHLQSYFIPKEGFLAGLTLNYDSVVLKPQYQDILLYYGYDISAFNVALYPPPKLPPAESTSTSTNSTQTTPTVAVLSCTTQTARPAIEVFDSIASLYTSTTTGTAAPNTTTIIPQKTSDAMGSPIPAVPSTTSQETSTTIPTNIQADTSPTIVVPIMSGELISTTNTSEVDTIPTLYIKSRTGTAAMKTENSPPGTSIVSAPSTSTTDTTTFASYTHLDATNLSKLRRLIIGDDSSEGSTENTSTVSESTTLEAISSQATSVYSTTQSTDTASDEAIEDQGQSTTEVPEQLISTTERPILTTGAVITETKDERITSPEAMLENTTENLTTNTEASLGLTEEGQVTTGTMLEQITEQQTTTEAMVVKTTERHYPTTEAVEDNIEGEQITEQQTTTEAMVVKTTERHYPTTEAVEENIKGEQITEQQTTTEAMVVKTTERNFSTTEAVVENTKEEQITEQQTTTEAMKEVTTERNFSTTEAVEENTKEEQITTGTTLEVMTEQQTTTEAMTGVSTERLMLSTEEDKIESIRENTIEQNPATDSPHKRVAKSVANYIKYREPFYHTTYNYPIPSTGEEPSYFLSHGRYKDYNVNFMRYDTMLPICNVAHLDARALKFPLDRKEYYLLILLPNRIDGVDALVRDLRFNGNLRQIVEGLRVMRVHATVPSFKMEGYLKLTNLFQRLGIRKVFEPNQGDFTPMTDQKQIYVLNIEQSISVNIKHYVDIENMNRKHSLPWEFNANHPFLFFVMDSQLQVALMSGKITNPLNTRIS